MNIVQGSIGSMMESQGKNLAQAMLDIKAVVIIDVSGSMANKDDGKEKTRFEIANDELATVQTNNPGHVAVIEFSDSARLIPYGALSQPDGTTNVAAALMLAKSMDGFEDIKFILVSDGEPNNAEMAFQIGRQFHNPINTIYVGPKNNPSGAEFLKKLSAMTGGESSAQKLNLLSNVIAGYLN